MPPKDPKQIGMVVEPPSKRRRAEAETMTSEERAWLKATAISELLGEALTMLNEVQEKVKELQLENDELRRQVKGEQPALVSRKTVLALVEKYLVEEAEAQHPAAGPAALKGGKASLASLAEQPEEDAGWSESGYGYGGDDSDDWGPWKGHGSWGYGYGSGNGGKWSSAASASKSSMSWASGLASGSKEAVGFYNNLSAGYDESIQGA